MPANDTPNSNTPESGTLPVSVASKPIWKNIGPRAVSAVLFAAICVPPIVFGGYIWAIFVLILGLRLVLEWVRMTDPDGNIIAMAIPMAGLTIAIGYVAGSYGGLAAIALIVTALAAAAERFRRGAPLWSGLGFLYVAVPTVLMIAIRGDVAGLSDGLKAMLFIILVVIGADVGAYLGGSAMKGPKIAPKLSPNKTWSGFFSGVLLGCILAVVTGKALALSTTFSLLLAIPIIVFSVVGDFFESGVKRHFNVKDTGKLMPGHGGLLDRLDGLMLAVVASALVLWAVPSIWPGIL